MKKVTHRLLLFGGLLLGVLFLQPVIAQDLGSGGIGGRPANPREDNERSESIFIHTIDAGQSVSDGIRLLNNTDEERTVQVYATDSLVSSGGAFACKQFVDPKEDVGAWIELEKEEVVLSGSANEVVDFTINVPELTDVGEHDGCIVVQEKKPIPENEEGIGLSFRTAIRVAILVPGDIVKDLSIVDFTAQVDSENVTLTPKIQNKGNVSIDADITTKLNYFFGMNASTEGGSYPVLREEIGEWNFRHEKPFWGGFFNATVEATYDASTDSFLGDDKVSNKTITYESLTFFVFPHPLAFAIELLILGVVALLIYAIIKRMRLKKTITKKWKTYTVRAGEDIVSIAKIQGIRWKFLAKANGLKAPYALKPGDSIKVPKHIPTKSKPKKKPTKKIDVV